MMELNEEVRFERTMELAKKAGVSIEDARAALVANDYDMLDSMIYLEHLGKTTADKLLRATNPEEERANTRKKYKKNCKGFFDKVFTEIGNLIKKGNENFLNLVKGDKEIIRIPLTIVVLLLVISFWFFLPLAIVLLFFGVRYYFSGEAFKEDDAFNGAMKKASATADNIKREFGESVNE